MSDAALSAALALCLGAGAVDLLALNLLVLPAVRAPLPLRIRPEAPARVPAPPIAAHDRRPELATRLLPAPLSDPAPRAEPQPLAILEFDVASRRIDRRASSALGQTLAQLRDAADIVVIGHADASGPKLLNERLSALRAAAVARRLVEAGVPAARLSVVARGEREPRRDGNSRRVELFLGGRP